MSEKVIIFLCLFLASLSTWASPGFDSKSFRYPNTPEAFAPYMGYQQQELRYEDLDSDVALLVQLTQTPKNLKSQIFNTNKEARKRFYERAREALEVWKKDHPFNVDNFFKGVDAFFEIVRPSRSFTQMDEEDARVCLDDYTSFECRMLIADYKNRNANIEGKVNPLKKKEFVRMLTAVIAEEYEKNGLIPEMGQVHRWSPENRKELLKEFPMFAGFSKLLIALALGKTSVFMITGQEHALVKAMMKNYAPRSIEPSDLFRESYRLNKGNIYLSLLTIENLLSRFWKSPNREQLTFIRQLKPIINTYESRGDNYGSWYHLFGIMLYGYVEGTAKAYFVAQTETLGSHILGLGSDGKDETQEDFINGEGAKIGGALKKAMKQMIEEESYKNFNQDPEALKLDSYLNRNEDFRDRLSYPLYGKIRIEQTETELIIENKGDTDFRSCELTIFKKRFANGIYSQEPLVSRKVDFKREGTIQVKNQFVYIPMVKAIFQNCSYMKDGVEKKFDFAFEANFDKAI